MVNIRSRLVNFRVTDEEFARLKAASDTCGARCLSEFARAVMLGAVEASPDSRSGESVRQELTAFSRRLAAVESNLSRLMEALAALKAIS